MADQPVTLVTGGTGFVGSAVARKLLARGHRVKLLVRPNSDRSNVQELPVHLCEGDLKDPASLQNAVDGCDHIFHVAADYRLWVPDPDQMMKANVEGSVALFRAGHAAGVRKSVYCSSVAALRLPHHGALGDETSPESEADVIGIYKKSKYRAEKAVMALVRDEYIPIVTVNPSTPIGPRDIKPTPTGKLILDAARGKMPAYLNTGLNVVHVDDVAEGHCLALEKGEVGENYILGGENLPITDILAMVDREMGMPRSRFKLPAAPLYPVAVVWEWVARLTGGDAPLNRDTLKMAQHLMYFSSAKAGRVLGYRPRPAAEAIRDAVAWFRAQGRVTP